MAWPTALFVLGSVLLAGCARSLAVGGGDPGQAQATESAYTAAAGQIEPRGAPRLERYDRAIGWAVPASGAKSSASSDPALKYDDTIVTISARTQDFSGQGLIPRIAHLRRSGRGSTLSVWEGSVGAVYGIDEATTISLRVPYLSKSLRQPDPGGSGMRTLTSEGFGDVLVMGKRRLFQELGPARTTEASLLFGVEVPTGSTSQRDAGMRLPRPLQPGSGSWDPTFGGAFTRLDGRWLVNADALVKFNTGANGYRFGHQLRMDIGAQYRLIPAKYERFDETTVNLVLEANARYAGMDRASGVIQSNTGGWRLFLTPGVQVIANENLLFEAAVQVPVLQDLNGTQLRDEYTVIVGLRALF